MKTNIKIFFLFILAFFLIPSFASAQTGSSPIFSFAVISDTHDANQCGSKQGKWSDMAIEIINTRKPDFVIGVGDLVAGGGSCPNGGNGIEKQLEEFKKVYLDKLNVPFIPMAGNHDFSTEPTHAKTAWNNFWNSNKNKVLSNGSFSGYPRSYTFTHKGIKFDILDYYGNYGYNTAEKQWIKSNVTSGDLVFRHVNPYGVTNAHFAMRSTGNIKDYEQLTELLKQKGVKALFSGHTHGFYEGICDNLHFINTGSLGARSMEYAEGIPSEFQKKQAFVWVDVLSGGAIDVSFYYYNGTGLVKFDKTNFPKTIEAKKITRTKDGKTFYEGVAATCKRVDSLVQTAGSQKILMIGDSHSAHYFYGKHLHKLIREAGFQVKLYGIGGTTSKSWMSGKKGTGKLISSVHADEQGIITPLPTGETYTLKNLKETYKPDTVIISLGSNEVPKEDSFFSTFDAPLAEIAATGAKCYWVGPPKITRKGFEKFQETSTKIKAIAESKGCTFIDSIPLSDDSLLKADGIHYTQPGGEQWAAKVFAQLNLTQNLIYSTSKSVISQMTIDEVKELLRTPSTKITIPGLNFSTKEEVSKMVTDENGNFYIHIPFLAEYLVAIYKYGIIAGGVIAIVMLVIQGFSLVTSGGNSTKTSEAKKKIGNLAIGFLLLIGSYLILYIINPQLLTLKSLKVLYVKELTVDAAMENTDMPDGGPIIQFGGANIQFNNTEIDGLKKKSDYNCSPQDIADVGHAYGQAGICLRPKTCASTISFLLNRAGCKKKDGSEFTGITSSKALGGLTEQEMGWIKKDIRQMKPDQLKNLPVGVLFKPLHHSGLHIGKGKMVESSYGITPLIEFSKPKSLWKQIKTNLPTLTGINNRPNDLEKIKAIDKATLIPNNNCPIHAENSQKYPKLCEYCDAIPKLSPTLGPQGNGYINHYLFESGVTRMDQFDFLYYKP